MFNFLQKEKASKLAFSMLSFLMWMVIPHLSPAQVNTGGSANTSDHNKQVIGYITNWDAWKAANAGLPAQGALTHMNIDYSKYTILNYSFFGVAQDGSLHSGDLRNKNIYQNGSVQQPGDIFYTDIYSSWDLHILFGEIDPIQWVNEDVKQRAEAQGFQVEVGGTTWTNTNWGLSGSLPLPLHKEGGAAGLLDMAHANGVKVVASIGGWSMCKHFPEMAADPAKRARFIQDCVNLINTGFDGIDLDWEYPGPFSGMNFTGSEADYGNFLTLVQEIRAAIGPDKLITAAMAADPAKLQGFNWPQLAATMDYFNMMTYDFNGGWSDIAGHNAPVYPYDGAEAPDFNWQSTYNAMMAMGVPSNKINFGIPFYGRGVVTTGNADLNAPTVKSSVTVQPDGPISTASDYTNWPLDVYDGTPNYFFIKQKTGSGSGWTRHWDNQAKVPYMTNGKYFLSYDDEESIAIKSEFIKNNNLAGTIIWTVFGDLEFSGSATNFGTKLKRWSNVSSPLINTVNEVFADGITNPGNNAPSVSISTPQNNATYTAGQSVSITANASDSDGTVTLVEFYANGSKIGQDSSSPFSYNWSSPAAGSYTLTARATDNDNATSTSSSVSITVEADDNGGGGEDCPNANFRVVGYMPSWSGTAASIQYEKLTHINYSFILPNADGSLQGIENPQKLQQIVTSAHNVGTKVLIAVGGWNDGNDSNFGALASNASTRTNFVNSLMSFVSQYNLDGVDMDWEYPREGNEPQNYELMMQELGAALHSNGKILTAAVVASGWNADGILSGVFDDIDFLNIMAYDGGDGASHSPYSYAVTALDYWLGRGLPASKAVLGVPFYGRPTWRAYNVLIAAGANPNQDVFEGTYYNGIPTIKSKTQLALDRASGIMIWEISQDTQDQTSLLSAIDEELGDCNNNPDAPSVSITSPSNNASFDTGSTISLTASASDSDGNITSVVFNVGGQNITASGSGSTYSASWTAAAEGTYVITATATDNDNLTSTAQVSITVSTPGSCDVPAWNASTAYTGGAHVSYNGVEYEARWWTQNENPASNSSEWQVWKVIGDCGGGNGGGNEDPTINVSLTAPGAGQTFTAGDNITISASASISSGSITKVEFYNGGSKLGEDSSAPYSITWSGVAAGSYTISAKAISGSYSATSGSTNITVESNGGGGNCNAPQYVNGSTYQTGDIVQNNGNTYQCKVGGWCSIGGPYTPGGADDWAWPDAWQDLGPCSSAARINLNSSDSEVAQFGLKAYPNPVHDTGIIEFSTPEAGSASLVIYNQIGEVADFMTIEKVSEGKHTVEFSTEKIPAGLYIIRISMGEKTQSIKILKD
ncbi:glycosyl hydrolase family 18 protein [Fulvivirga ligni]|uniref:glycosyl hydrolase family 18 protein n=1 Tax=Fulvivirga ligni TaxID=2904246 RepID=UPI001F2A9D4D|nr:glycosyl hydrolase family 18 protein [Fulvivirga ligni]UII22859.1 glycosyl hydrolase family 18 protein [Fulvivirga ligni]